MKIAGFLKALFLRAGKRAAGFAAALVLGGALLATGCSNPLEPDVANAGAQASGPGTLVLTMADARARTIAPIWPENVSFTINLVSVGGGNENRSEAWNGKSPITLSSGTWKLTVTAYIGDEGSKRELSRSEELTFAVSPGGTVERDLKFVPISEGQGTFSWDIPFSANVTAASMQVLRADGSAVWSDPVVLIGTGGAKSGSRSLNAGRYRAVFTLGSENGETTALERALIIYKNMDSPFDDNDGLFKNFIFPSVVGNVIVNAWDGARWNLAELGITAGHFGLLDGVKGIDANTSPADFNAFVGWFNKLSAPAPAPYDGARLPALIDAAYVGISGERGNFLAGVELKQPAVEAAIRKIEAPNGTAITNIEWSDDGYKSSVTIGGYKVAIVFAAPVTPLVKRTVTFDPRNGDEITSVEVEEGQTVTAPAEPVKAGYAFGGWLTSESREVTIGMWSSRGAWGTGNGWQNSAALRININGVDLTPNARLASGEIGTYTFTVNQADDVRFYWVGGDKSSDWHCAFAVWYTDAPPVPAFDPERGAWSPSKDPQGKVLAYKEHDVYSGIANGNGTLMGAFIAREENEFDFNTPITGDITLSAMWAPIPSSVTIASTHILTAQVLELAFAATVKPEGALQKVIWNVTGNPGARFDGNVLIVAADADPGEIKVTVAVQGYPGITASRTVRILPNSDSVARAAGATHTMGIKADGSLWAWGDNPFGQLGNNSTTDSKVPVPVAVGQKWKSVSTGGNVRTGIGNIKDRNTYSMGIKEDGTLWGWGYTYNKGFGDDSPPNRLIPTEISGGGTWVSVSSGRYSAARLAGLKADRSLWAWGAGSIGDGTTGGAQIPTAIAIGERWASVSVGNEHTVGIKTNGSLWTWGVHANNGVLGGSSYGARLRPTAIAVGESWVSVSAGNHHTVGIKTDGSLWAWGMNNRGQLGDNTTNDRNVPTKVSVSGVATWAFVSAGSSYTMGIKTDGSLWGWGFNGSYRLGDNTTTDRKVPTAIAAGQKWASVSAGYEHTVGVKADGSLWGWGDNGYYQIVSNQTAFVKIPTAIAAGEKWRPFVTVK